MGIMNKCIICNEETKNKFNIYFKLVSICERCANSIFIQQAEWFAKEACKKSNAELDDDFCTCNTGGEGNGYESCGICGKQYKDYKHENWIE
jgi:hypothetical protein